MSFQSYGFTSHSTARVMLRQVLSIFTCVSSSNVSTIPNEAVAVMEAQYSHVGRRMPELRFLHWCYCWAVIGLRIRNYFLL